MAHLNPKILVSKSLKPMNVLFFVLIFKSKTNNKSKNNQRATPKAVFHQGWCKQAETLCRAFRVWLAWKLETDFSILPRLHYQEAPMPCPEVTSRFWNNVPCSAIQGCSHRSEEAVEITQGLSPGKTGSQRALTVWQEKYWAYKELTSRMSSDSLLPNKPLKVFKGQGRGTERSTWEKRVVVVIPKTYM